MNNLPNRHILFAAMLAAMFASGMAHSQSPSGAQAEPARPAPVAVTPNPATRVDPAAPAPDEVMHAQGYMIPRSYPRPASEWKEKRKATYAALLDAAQSDILVVPVQVQNQAFNPAMRLAMTALLAQAISGASSKALPDPFVVDRALGEGERRIDPDAVYRLAERLGARRVVWTYAGHNIQTKTMNATVRVQTRQGTSPITAATPMTSLRLTKPAFDEFGVPLGTFREWMPRILGELGLAPGAAPPAAAGTDSAAALPANPKDMLGTRSMPARDAGYFQLLAALTPARQQATRTRFAVKSMLAAEAIPSGATGSRLLKARALRMLELRPLALKLLENPQGAEERAEVAVLNGDLTGLEAIGTKMAPGLNKAIARLDAATIGAAYRVVGENQVRQYLAGIGAKGEIWPFLFARALSDPYQWAQFENLQLKGLLVHEYPIKDTSSEAMMRGAAGMGDKAKLTTLISLAAADHIEKLFSEQGATLVGAADVLHPRALDYLDLIEATAVDNLMRQARFLTDMQGRPQDALDFLARIETTLRGHPEYALVRAEAQARQARQIEGRERQNLQKAANAAAVDALFLAQGESLVSADALTQIGQLARTDYDGTYIRNFYEYDLPRPPGSFDWSAPAPEQKLRMSMWQFTPVRNLAFQLEGEPQQLAAMFKALEGRYVGNPAISTMLAANSEKQGDWQAAERHYREGVRMQPGAWPATWALGRMLFRSGKVESAFKVFKDFPGFDAKADDNPVEISNHANEAGSMFFWAGHLKEATALYKVATRRSTGSESDFTGGLRLKLIDGDIVGASQGSLARARRYQSVFGYRDLVSFQHASGNAKAAWDTFALTAPRQGYAAVWESALVGHRIEGTPEDKVIAWARQDAWRQAGDGYSPAATFLLRAAVMDRVPSPDMIAAIAALERPVWLLDNQYRQVVRENLSGQGQPVLGPKSVDNATLPLNVFSSSKKLRIKSDLLALAEAYPALRAGDYAAAYAALQPVADAFDLSLTPTGYLLPYYAIAAAKSGHTAEVEKLLAGFTPDKQGMDYQLARAVLAATAGKSAEALDALNLALYRRRPGQERPLTYDFEYCDISEWLFLLTKDRKYADVALKLAKVNERVQPWISWSYAMDARLNTNATEKRRALGMAAYLDRQSERLKAFPKAEVDAALKLLESNNPFLKSPAKAGAGPQAQGPAVRPIPATQMARKSRSGPVPYRPA